MSSIPATPFAAPETPQPQAPRQISQLQQLGWSVRRELWENRSIYLAPLSIAGIILFGFTVGAVGLRHMGFVPSLDLPYERQSVAAPYDFAAALIMFTAIVVSIFYCLDALYGERRDRSILFWKSLPVSDRTAVLAKASVPLLILPFVAFVITVVTQLGMLLLSSAVLLSVKHSVGPLWSILAPLRMWAMLFYHLFAVHSLWYAPIYAWFLLVSAWARRTPLLWAFLPPVAIGIFEKIVFNTSHFLSMLGNRLAGGTAGVTGGSVNVMPLDPGMHLDLASYLGAPGLWIGFAVTALFLAGAVRLRRYREPI